VSGEAARAALGVLPFLAGAVLVLAIGTFRRDEEGGGLRRCVLVAAAVWGVWAVAGCEVLSFGRWLTFWPVLAWWGLPLALLAGVLWARRERLRGLFRVPAVAWGVWVPLVVTVALVVLAGVVAGLSAPNTVDALTYHMPRQVRWMQQGSVEHFAVRELHQLMMHPMAEFAGVQMMVPSGGDWYATLVQWTALVIAAMAASLVVRELVGGGRPVAQAMAALLVVSNPMAWIQASGAKNDVVVAAWVLVLAYWAARVMRDGRCGMGRAVMIGCAAGLAVLTKPTGAMYALPLLVLIAGVLLYRQRARCVPAGVVMAVAAAVIVSGFAARNVRAFGSPLPAGQMRHLGRPLSNEAHTPGIIASNIVRNVASHMGTPWPRVNGAVYGMIEAGHRVMGQDLNDERATAYSSFSPFAVKFVQNREDRAGAPIHVILAMVALGMLVVMVCRRGLGAGAGRAEWWRIGGFAAAVVAGCLLFCLVLKWQPWHPRLHVGALALAAPMTAAVLTRGRGGGAVVASAVLLLPLAPTVLWNEARPLVGPRNVWATARAEMADRAMGRRAGVDEAVEFVRLSGASVVGIVLHRDGEYAFMRRLLRGEPPPLMTDPLAPMGVGRPWPRPDVAVADNPHAAIRYRETSTGAVLYRVRQIGGYHLYAGRETAERLHREGLIDALPEFVGE
jgi:hypothetical protein